MTIIKKILERETKGLNINDKTRDERIFSYDEVEGMLNEMENNMKKEKHLFVEDDWLVQRELEKKKNPSPRCDLCNKIITKYKMDIASSDGKG